MMQITITTDLNPEAWGSECDEATAQKAAEIHAAMLGEYAKELWPDAEIEECAQRNHVVMEVTGVGDEIARSVARRLHHEAEATWDAALEGALTA